MKSNYKMNKQSNIQDKKKQRFNQNEISLCPKCHCATHTIKGKFPRCGKCGELK